LVVMMKETGMANTAMSKGDMRGACKSCVRAQKMASARLRLRRLHLRVPIREANNFALTVDIVSLQASASKF